MKSKLRLILLLLITVPVIARSQDVSNVSVSGNLTVGSTVSGNYIIQGSPDNILYNWYEVLASDTTGIGTGTQTLTIPASSLNKRLLFKVTLIVSGTVADSAYSPLSPVVTANQPPVATNVSVSGDLNVNDYLLGDYSYSDPEGDPEGNSVYEWRVSSSATGIPYTVTGTNSRTYKISLADAGKYLFFNVTPIAQTGTSGGTSVTSATIGPVNSAPYATSVTITGTAAYPNTIKGKYTYNDDDNDLQGTSVFQWYRNGLPVDGANDTIYVLTVNDIGEKLKFAVTPVSATGYPDTGSQSESPETVEVADLTGDRPSASDVCINGTRSVGSLLSGRYTFYDPKFNEQNSIYLWFRGTSRVPVGTSQSYAVQNDDLDSELFFAVIPRNNKGVRGDTVFSQTLAIINLPSETFSIADPEIILNATPSGGIFYGTGVSNGKFNPAVAGEGGPYTINYFLNIANPSNSCSQLAARDVNVNSITSYFDSFRNVYCSNGGYDTIYVANMPAGSKSMEFRMTNWDAVVDTSGATIIIDPSLMRPGNKIDTLFFSYDYEGSVYPLSKPFVVDSVGTALSFANLDPAYCEGSVRKYITIQGIYPAGGTGSWTGDILSDMSVASAFIEPEMGMPSVSYPITYRYTSPLGCQSATLSRTVTINPKPNPGFPLKQIYNVDGPPETLVPVTPGGIFTGPGISGYDFYPNIAGQGTHQIKYTVTDSNGCSADSTKTTEVKKASGTITGLNPGNQYCYDGTPDTIGFTSSVPWLYGIFSGPGIQDMTGGNAIFTPSVAGKGDHRIIFAYIDYTLAYFEIYQTVNVDSIGQVTIENLKPDTVFCDSDPSFTLYTNRDGGVFSGPVSGNIFTPSMGPGNDPVVYTFTNSRTGCSSTVTVPVTIFASPTVEFTVADSCIEHLNDTTRFINNTASADPVTEWLWEFRDGGGVMISNAEEPGYLYSTGGLRQVRLTATTINGCAASVDKNIDLGVKPEADFYWLNECYHPDDSVKIFDLTLTGSPVISRTWNFFDGNPPLTSTNPKYPKISDGYIPVEYIVYTNYAGCSDTVRKEIFIRPTIKLTTDDYFENFEGGPGGWIRDQGVSGSWTLGSPDRPVIDNAASGTNAWFTSYDIANQAVLSSSVSSPCFDFTETERPMISLKLWRRFDRNRDGAALQYKIGDEPGWEYLGTIGDGIEWYNSTLIKGRPGGDQIGWTTLQSADTGWVEARHRLDELNGRQDVKFRIAYGSDGTSQDNDGIAFDDVRIGARTRFVLLEHFTNNSSVSVVRANGIVNTVASQMENDVININYHTGFPGPDILYDENQSDMSARVLFYGLSKVPWSFIDGGTGDEYAGVFDYVVADLDSIELNKRSLINPRFRIDINPVVSAGLLVVGANLTATENLNEENLTLYLSVTANEITSVSATNGETLFRNTLRKMLPDAGGINLPKVWTKGQEFTSADYTWKVTNIHDADDIRVIAFIQNNITREIYQATVSEITDVSVGIDDVYGEEAGFILYPNPSSGRVALLFSDTPGPGAFVEITDQTGVARRKYSVDPGSETFVIDDHGLSNGVYIVRVISGNVIRGIRKLVVSGR